MITWKNLDTASAYQELLKVVPVDLKEAMTGEGGAERVKKYSVPMAAGLAFNYAAKQVDDKALEAFTKLAAEMHLAEKFEALYNGEVINTGEKRLVLHHLTRGQLGEAVAVDGVDKRTFYAEQQRKYTGSLIEASMSARDNLETIRKEKGKAFFFPDAAADRTGHRSHKETRLSDFGRAD